MRDVLPFAASLLFLAGFAHAAPFVEQGTCGTAKVVSGDTCSNVKVEFDFAGCDLKSAPQIAQKISCEKTQIKARFQEGDLRYEASFDKVANGWGAVTWKQLGEVRQLRRPSGKPAPKAAVAVIPPAEPAVAPPHPPAASAKHAEPPPPPAIAAPAPPSPAPTASPLKVSFYADLRFTSVSTKDDASIANPYAESGFGFEEGAVALNYERDRFTFVADVAIRRMKDGDFQNLPYTTPGASVPPVPNQSVGTSTLLGNGMTLGTDRSQMFLKYKSTDWLTTYFGQFDTIYGVELNDSKDRVFGKTGLVYDLTLPVTHTGLMFEAAMGGGSYAKLLAANPNNRGTFGAAGANEDNRTEYGAAVGWANENWRAQLGLLSRPLMKADGTETAARNLVDLTAGTTWGHFAMDLEVAQVSDPGKNTLTATDNTDLENAGVAMMLLPSYRFNDEFLVGVRLETVKDDPASLGMKSATAGGVSIHYRVAPELETRLEVVNVKWTDMAEAEVSNTRANVAAVVTF